MMAHHTPTSGRRVAALALSAFALGTAGLAVDAATSHAATVGPQKSRAAGEKFPVTLPGGFARGERIPRGHVLVSRTLKLRKSEKNARTSVLCPRGKSIRTGGQSPFAELGFSPIGDVYRTQPRRIPLRVYSAPAGQIKGSTADGTVYILCGPRRPR